VNSIGVMHPVALKQIVTLDASTFTSGIVIFEIDASNEYASVFTQITMSEDFHALSKLIGITAKQALLFDSSEIQMTSSSFGTT